MTTKHVLSFFTLGLVMLLGGLVVRDTPSVQAKAADGIPPGAYHITITEGDLPPLPPDVIEILVGEWETVFIDGGSYVVTKDGEVAVVGRYSSHSDQLVMTDHSGSLACTDEHGIATGIYQWSLENDELVLTPVNDRCFGRSLVLTASALQRQ